MNNKMLKAIVDDIKVYYKYYLFLLIFSLLFFIRLDYYVYSPGGLDDLTNRIEVENAYSSKGSFNLTYVTSRDGSLFNLGLSYLIPSWDIESVDESRIDDESINEIEERNKTLLKETSYDAIIAAFSEANIPYNIDSIDVTVTYVFKEANTDLKVGDIIKKINGVSINSFEELKNEISKYYENDKINIEVIRKNKTITCNSTLFKEGEDVLIGVSLSELKTISTNPKVEYVFRNNESGSSRGLMCALDIYNKITPNDLTKGRIIAGTGSIDANGVVGKISGVKYKLAGAVRKKASIFIVPSDNYEEAVMLKEKNNYNIEIISASTIHDVIEKLSN